MVERWELSDPEGPSDRVTINLHNDVAALILMDQHRRWNNDGRIVFIDQQGAFDHARQVWTPNDWSIDETPV